MRAGFPGVMSAARGGGFSPRKIGGLVADYDASKNAYLSLSGTEIIQFLDQSGNGNHTAAQGTSTRRANVDTVTTSNGLQTAMADGGDSYDLPSALYSLPNGSLTIFSVSKRETEDGTLERIFTLTEGGASRVFDIYNTTAGSRGFRSSTGAGSATSTGNTNTDFNISYGRRDGTTVALSINGEAENTDASGADESGVDGGGLLGTSASAPAFDGNFCQSLFYNKSLSATEISQVLSFLSKKWGVTLV